MFWGLQRAPYFVLTEYMVKGSLSDRLKANYSRDQLLGFYDYLPWRCEGKHVLNRSALTFALSMAAGIQALHFKKVRAPTTVNRIHCISVLKHTGLQHERQYILVNYAVCTCWTTCEKSSFIQRPVQPKGSVHG